MVLYQRFLKPLPKTAGLEQGIPTNAKRLPRNVNHLIDYYISDRL